jgi:hypothetical protein
VRKLLVTVTLGEVPVNVAGAGCVGTIFSVFVTSVRLMVLTLAPVLVGVTLTVTLQVELLVSAAALVTFKLLSPPVRAEPSTLVTVPPTQLVVTGTGGVATTKPVGKLSVAVKLVKLAPLRLIKLMVIVEGVPTATLAGEKLLAKSRERIVTVVETELPLVAPWSLLISLWPIVFVKTPPTADLTIAVIVHLSLGLVFPPNILPPVSVTEEFVFVIDPPVQVVVGVVPVLIFKPEGKVSVKLIPVIFVVVGFVIVIVRVLSVLIFRVEGENAFPTASDKLVKVIFLLVLPLFVAPSVVVMLPDAMRLV